MAECIVLKGGSGADLDAITAGAGDVLAPKVIVGPDGEPLTGIMPNRGAISQALGINGTYTIPEGYHNGSGKVTQNVATLTGQTINPTASQQTVASSGKYMTGNVVVNGVSNLTAANVKKGVNVGGTVGTWEGYVPGAQDIYYYGNNISNFTSTSGTNLVFQEGQIKVNYGQAISMRSGVWINMVGKSQLNVQGIGLDTSSSVAIRINIAGMNSQWSGSISTNSSFTASIPLATLQVSEFLTMTFAYMNCTVTRIWLT